MYTFANNVDPDKMAHYEPSHQDLHCLPDIWYSVLHQHVCSNGAGEIFRDRTGGEGLERGLPLQLRWRLEGKRTMIVILLGPVQILH